MSQMSGLLSLIGIMGVMIVLTPYVVVGLIVILCLLKLFVAISWGWVLCPLWILGPWGLFRLWLTQQ